MRISEDYKNLLDTKGVSLSALQIRGVALKRDDALRAIIFLRDAGIPILGGDVYFQHGSRIELAYANWHTDQTTTEEWKAYLIRSWDNTEKYVKEFPVTQSVEPLFALVTTGEVKPREGHKGGP